MATPNTCSALLEKIITPYELKQALYNSNWDDVSDIYPRFETAYAHSSWTYMNYWARTMGHGTPFKDARSFEENLWIIREYVRMVSGVYRPVEIYQENTNLGDYIGANRFFMHQSLSDPKLIAYTPDEEYGKLDRQVQSKLGKFLTKYAKSHFNGLSGDTIRELASKYAAARKPFELRLAAGEAEIERVYRECATQSCMSKETTFWAHLVEASTHRKVHPTFVYDHPSISLAYVINAEDRIVSRTLINNVTRKWIRIYGDTEAMLHLLRTEMGITSQGTMEGVSLKKITLTNGRILCPYIDGNVQRVTPDDDVLKVVRNGDYAHADYMRACISIQNKCPHCETRNVPSDTEMPDHVGYPYSDPVCDNCLHEHTVLVYFRPAQHIRPMQEPSADFNPRTGCDEAVIDDPLHWWVDTENESAETMPPHPDKFFADARGNRYLASEDWSEWLCEDYQGGLYPRKDVVSARRYNVDSGTVEWCFASRMDPNLDAYMGNATNTPNKRLYLVMPRYMNYEEAMDTLFKGIITNTPKFGYQFSEVVVNAVFARNGARTKAPMHECIQDIVTEVWYTRKYAQLYLDVSLVNGRKYRLFGLNYRGRAQNAYIATSTAAPVSENENLAA